MTTGTFTVGSTADGSPFYATKTWTGGNGKTQENPYTMTKTRIEYGGLDRSYDQFGAFVVATHSTNCQCWGVAGSGPALSGSNFELSVLNDLSEKVRGHNFNAAVFCAELPEACKMLVSSIRSLTGVFTGFRQRNLHKIIDSLVGATGLRDPIYSKKPRHLKMGAVETLQKDGTWRRHLNTGDISGAFLAAQYGWKPLLQDIFELTKSIEAKSRPGVRNILYKVHRNEQFKTTAANLVPYLGGFVHHQNRIAYKVRLRENPSFLDTLGFTDPASVLWEKTPFSFVLDWALPIGDFLQARGFVNTLPPDTVALKTVFMSSIARTPPGSVTGPTGGLTPNWKITCASRVKTDISLVRTNSVISVPAPSMKTLEKAFSLTHLANAGALVHQLVGAARKA